MHRTILAALGLLVTIPASAQAFTLGAQDPDSLRHGRAAASFAAAHAIGARYWRVLVPAHERTSVTRARVEAVRAAGFRPFLTIGGAFNGGTPSLWQLRRLAPLADRFTVYNEPDLRHVSPRRYRRLYIRARRTIRRANRHARVLVCDCTATAANYLRRLGRLRTDGIAWHPYPAAFPSWRKPSSVLRRTRSVMRAARRLHTRRVWATETGYPPGAPASWWPLLVRTLAHHGVDAVLLYHVRSTGRTGWDTGLLNADGTPRRSFVALRSARFAR